MKNLLKFATATAATAMLASAAHAQTASTDITLAVSGTSDIQAEVNLVETAVLAGQTGMLSFTVTPGDVEWGVVGLSADGFVTVTLDNGVFGSAVAANPVVSTGADCVPGAVNIEDGGTALDSSVTISIPGLATCDADPAGAAPGVVEITVPFALASVADANFSVGVITANATLADTTAYTVNMGPLVETGPAFTLAFMADTADDHDLSLGLDPAFSAFDDDATDFQTDLGDLVITSGFADSNLQGDPVGAPMDLDISVTASASAAGIASIEINGPGTEDASLELDTGTSTFSGMVAGGLTLAGGPPTTATFDIVAVLDGDADPEMAASTAAQNFSATATVTAGAAELMTSGALASIGRDGFSSDVFEWVALEEANLNNQFRFTGLQEGSSVFVTVSDINTAPTADGGNLIADFNLSATDLISITPGGEAQFSARGLGNMLEEAGVLDRSNDEVVTRATVQFFVEQTGLEIRRLMFNADGAVNSTGEFAPPAP